MLLLKTIMGIVFRKVKVLELILNSQHIILNLLLIKETLLLKTHIDFVCLMVEILRDFEWKSEKNQLYLLITGFDWHFITTWATSRGIAHLKLSSRDFDRLSLR
jgi:D-alanyl-lipoteichoic acid acyltransferase DltB (MBOAT superfamily)